MESQKLQTGNQDDLILPQIFIDGHFVGNASDLQEMEDDGMLDEVLKREACVQCGYRRTTADKTCK
eukprot:3457335-Amphidinium_carterae.1